MPRYYENSPTSRGSTTGRGKLGNRGSTPRSGKSGLSRAGGRTDLREGRAALNNRGRDGSHGRGSFTPRGRGATSNSRGRGDRHENKSFENGSTTPSKFLFIKGFSKTTKMSDIQKLVKNAVNIHHKPGMQFATIEFNDIDSAKEAIAMFKSKEIDGNRLVVHFDRKISGGTPSSSFKKNSKTTKKYKKSGDEEEDPNEEDTDVPSVAPKKKSIANAKIVKRNISDEEEEEEDDEFDDETLQDENESDESGEDSAKVKSAKTTLKQVKQKLYADKGENNEDEDIEDEEDESYLSDDDLDDINDDDVESDTGDFSLPQPKAVKKQIATKKSANVKSAIVRLENVPKKAQADEIKKLVPNIVSVEKGNGQTFAKVEFSNIKSAKMGIIKLNGGKLRGNLLKASFFTQQSPNAKKTKSIVTEKIKAESKKSVKPVAIDKSDEDEEIDDEDELEDDDSLADELDDEEVENESRSDEGEDNEEVKDGDSDVVVEESSQPLKKNRILKTSGEKAKEKKQVKLPTINTNNLTPLNSKMSGTVSAQSTPHPSVGKLLRGQDGNIDERSKDASRKRKALDSIATDPNAKRLNTMANGEPVDEEIFVEEERRRKERDARTLFVNNVEKKLDYKHVKKILPDCANIRKSGNATFAFLTFDSEEAAVKAKKHIDNNPFCLSKQRATVDFVGEKSTKEDHKSTSGHPSEHAAKRLINPLCLYVGNLPPGKFYTKAKVVKYFPNATDVRTPKKTQRAGNYMFVDFASSQDARSAFDNNANLSIDGHVVEVCYARMNSQEQAIHKTGDAAVLAATKAQKRRQDKRASQEKAPSNVKIVKNVTSTDGGEDDEDEYDDSEDDEDENDDDEDNDFDSEATGNGTLDDDEIDDEDDGEDGLDDSNTRNSKVAHREHPSRKRKYKRNLTTKLDESN